MVRVKTTIPLIFLFLITFSSFIKAENYDLELDEKKAKEKYEKRRQELKKKHAEHKKRKAVDEALQEGEEWTAHEKYERENPEGEPDHELFTRETFFAEYEQETPEHPEVKMAKRFFPTKETKINKERYKTLLKMYMDGTVHDNPIDDDIREEAHKQLEEFLDEYVDSRLKDEFSVEDLFVDYIEGKFHDWIDVEHPQTDPDIEPDL